MPTRALWRYRRRHGRRTTADDLLGAMPQTAVVLCHLPVNLRPSEGAQRVGNKNSQFEEVARSD